MNKTGIEYLTHTWNPVAMRCTPVTLGCDHCWHLAMAKRHAANPTIRPEIREARGGGKFALLKDELEAPLRLKKPARVGVQYMGDLFHERIPFEWIAQVYFTMVGECSAEPAPQHIYLILTKRPGRMVEFYEWLRAHDRAEDEAWLASLGVWATMADAIHPRVWLGVSVEDQETADERIPLLLDIPAAVRFVSVEPMLGPVDFHAINKPHQQNVVADVISRHGYTRGLNWVIAGAEQGPGARFADPAWLTSVRDQCAAAGIPYFFKRNNRGTRTLEGKTHEEFPGVTP